MLNQVSQRTAATSRGSTDALAKLQGLQQPLTRYQKMKKRSLDDFGLVGCHSSRSKDLSVHARIDSSGHVRLLWESDDDKKGHAAIFEVKFGKRSRKAVAHMPQARERTAEQLSDQLESVALAAEGNDDPSEPTARCINDTKKVATADQIWTFSRLRCCVCHIHHMCAMKSLFVAREFVKTALQQVCHFKVDVIVGDANAAAYKYHKNQECQDLHNSSVAIMFREMQREVNTRQPFENRLHIDYASKNRPSQLHAAADLGGCTRFSRNERVSGKPDSKSLGTGSKNTTHKAYATSERVSGKRKDHRLENYKSNFLISEVLTL